MFPVSRLQKVILSAVVLSTLTGCASSILRVSGGGIRLSEIPQALTPDEVQQKFGPPVSHGTTNNGRKMEVFAVRVKRHNGQEIPEERRLAIDVGCTLFWFTHPCAYYLLASVPMALSQRSHDSQVVFVYRDSGEVLYFYDNGESPGKRFEQALRLAPPQLDLDAASCPDLKQCMAEYLEEARRRASEVGYISIEDEEEMRQFYIKINKKIGEGIIAGEETLRYQRPSLPHLYLFYIYSSLTNSFLKEIEESKCPSLARCVAVYVQAMRAEALNTGYTATSMDEENFQSELEIAREADEGKATREEASGRLDSIATRRLIRLFNRHTADYNNPHDRRQR